MRINNIFAAAAAFSLGTVGAHAASQTVYSNTNTYSGTFLSPGANGEGLHTSEIGDEINLVAGPRYAESFRFEYYGVGFTGGDERFRIRFYNNTPSLPTTVFYDSDWQSLAEPSVTGRASYQFDLTYAPIALPDRFTWSIQFDGIGAGETVGVPLYNPATVGFSEDDYWFRTGTELTPSSAWQLRGTNPTAFNFGAQLVATTVPEPSTYMLAIVGGLCGLALVHRRSRKA
jgi:hypothetical protein